MRNKSIQREDEYQNYVKKPARKLEDLIYPENSYKIDICGTICTRYYSDKESLNDIKAEMKAKKESYSKGVRK